jgi:hypothetical protein
MGSSDLSDEYAMGLIPKMCRRLIKEINDVINKEMRSDPVCQTEETLLSTSVEVSFVEIYRAGLRLAS